MKLLAICVAQPREMVYRGKRVRSSIWKEPVDGPVRMEETHLVGDSQATAVVHGGIHKAAYAYSGDHYDWWRQQLARDDLGHGMFGENLVVSGLDEGSVRIGDQWDVGSVRYTVSGPRIPCANLAMKFDDTDLPRLFTEAGRPGVYLRVLQCGMLQAGDSVDSHPTGSGPSIRDVYCAYTQPRAPGALAILHSVLRNPALDPEFGGGIDKRIRQNTPDRR